MPMPRTKDDVGCRPTLAAPNKAVTAQYPRLNSLTIVRTFANIWGIEGL